MGGNTGIPEQNARPNEVTLPPWRTDNIYSFVWALIIAIVTATASASAIYYNVVRSIDSQASDTKIIKQDISYIKAAIDKNEMLSEKKLDDHISTTANKIQELDGLALKVAAIEAKLKP